jgi:16S rRNA G966 N2-methylase RsmD
MIRIKTTGLVLAALCWFTASTAVHSQELGKLPYVPTPQVVVDEMLKMAGVTAKDFVVDLGSGDGRMIITAAQKYNANGLGVDIDPKLVELATRNARNEAVSDRAKFVEQDMFKADISKATVITLYVLPDFMEKLRPKLLRELKPGTRIVAHDYYMSDWYPDRQAELNVPEKKAANGTEKAYLYLWTVPAVVQGDWRMNWDFGDGKSQLIVLAFNQMYQIVNASAASRDGEMKIANTTVKGDDIDFFLTVGAANYRFSGKVQGDKMSGTAVTGAGGKPIAWSATKLPPEK